METQHNKRRSAIALVATLISAGTLVGAASAWAIVEHANDPPWHAPPQLVSLPSVVRAGCVNTYEEPPYVTVQPKECVP